MQFRKSHLLTKSQMNVTSEPRVVMHMCRTRLLQSHLQFNARVLTWADGINLALKVHKVQVAAPLRLSCHVWKLEPI